MECLPKLDASPDQNNAEPQTSSQKVEKIVDHFMVASIMHLLHSRHAGMLQNGSVTLSALKANHSALCNTVNVSPMKNCMTCSVNVDKLETIAQLILIVLMDLPV